MTRALPSLIRALTGDKRGAVIIETALMSPVLVLMSLGAFDVSRLVARHTELQEVSAEFAAIAMAKMPEEESIEQLREIAVASAGVEDDQVEIEWSVKCGADPQQRPADHDCGEDVEASTMLTLSIEDEFVPFWTTFGIGGPVDMDITRAVQIQ